VKSLAQTGQDTAAQVLKVLSFNTFFDCQAGVEVIADLIRKTEADLVGLQEVNESTEKLANSLGMHFLQQDKRTGLLSKYPIEKVSGRKYGVQVTLENGQKVAFCNAHLVSYPNQMYQLKGLTTAGGGPAISTESQAIWWANKTRGWEFRNMITDANSFNLPAICTGDFNEASHLDWTPAAVAAGQQPLKVEWPGSKQYEKAGFKDAYREFHPDEVTHPGHTWTPTAKPDDPEHKHDRIDFVQYRGAELQLKDVKIVGESPVTSDFVIDPYPSDHRGVLATFEVAAPR
jgi:endonuclease/exonuclease/phosphatase family metal-dependent hydrolase